MFSTTKSPNGTKAPEHSNAAAWPRHAGSGQPTMPPAPGSGRCFQLWGHAGSSRKGRDKRLRGLDRGATSITQPQLPPPHSWGDAGTPRTSSRGLTCPGYSLNLSECVGQRQFPGSSCPPQLPAPHGRAPQRWVPPCSWPSLAGWVWGGQRGRCPLTLGSSTSPHACCGVPSTILTSEASPPSPHGTDPLAQLPWIMGGGVPRSP